jgi:hypothetical protein
VQTYGLTQTVPPVQPSPPHWSHSPTVPAPVVVAVALVDVVVVAAAEVVVVAFVVMVVNVVAVFVLKLNQNVSQIRIKCLGHT